MKHVALIDGLGFAGEGRSAATAPTLLAFSGPDFVDRFLADLAQSDWMARLDARRARPQEDGTLRLDQPVHRAFHLAVVDARCLAAGFPRLDPLKIESAGLVIRREAPAGVLGWQSDAGGPLGWASVPSGALETRTAYEPDPERRRAKLEGGNAALLAKLDRLAGDHGWIGEETFPLFKIPDDLAKRIGRTLLFGYVPLAARPSAPREAPPPPFSADDVAARVPPLLRADRAEELAAAGLALPPAGAVITRGEARRPSETTARGRGVRALVGALTWLAQETGAFTGETYAAPLVAELSALAAPGAGQPSLYAWMKAANEILLQGSDPDTDSLTTPDDWATVDAARFGRIVRAAHGAMTARWGRLAPAEARYPAGRRRYHLRCFARLDDRRGCPPRAIWSPPSETFRIRPWYESGDAPPVQVDLPPLTQASLRDIKPNVAFKVPPEIQQFMDRMNLQDLMDGKSTKTSVRFGMICGFSIPIITICAFIVLQIFLALFHILFWWLPFIRICIPFPVVTQEEEP